MTATASVKMTTVSSVRSCGLLHNAYLFIRSLIAGFYCYFYYYRFYRTAANRTV